MQEIVVLDHDAAHVPRPILPGEPKQEVPSDPNRSMFTMGQTSRKFIVVPEVSHLLAMVAVQEQEEKDERIRVRKLKKEEAV